MFLSGTDKVPAPNSYSPHPPETHVQYSMRAKFEDKSDDWIKKVPGPGAYNQVQPINHDCKNFVARF